MINYLQEDIERIIQDKKILWETFRGKHVCVTGCTGLLGSIILHTLSRLNSQKQLGIKIWGVTRTPSRANEKFLNLNISFLTLQEFLKKKIEKVTIIHAGAPTSSASFVETPVEVIEDMLMNAFDLLKYCKESGSSFICLSTMEIYGNPLANPIKETDSSILSPISTRSSYPESKRMIETLCVSYFSEYGVDSRIVRLTQCFGAGVDILKDNRVFSEFSRKIIKGEDIVLKTSGESKRDYVYTSDAIRAVFYVITKGNPGGTYNISNPSTFCSILQMTKMLSAIYRVKVRVELESSEEKISQYAPKHEINLDTGRIQDLGWAPTISLPEAFERTIEHFKYQQNYEKKF